MSHPTVNPNGVLAGKVALVTGASRGIGEAIAARLAMEGAKVVITARTAEAGESKLTGSLHETLDRIRAAGGEATFVKADLSSAEDRERLVKEAVAIYGPIDILVNNAALNIVMRVADYTDKRYTLMMEVGVHAPFHLAQLVLPSMRARKQGWIVNISSGASRHPKPTYKPSAGNTVYGMVKAALERFTTGLSCEVYDDGIAVNVISPGLVETPGVAANGFLSEKARARLQPITYIAEAVLALSCCDPATMSGRIDHAAPFLEEFNLTPAELI